MAAKKENSKPEIEKPDRANSHANPRIIPSWWHDVVKWTDYHSPITTVILTGALVFIGTMQACIYRNQLDVIPKDQRPWIKVSFSFDTPISPNDGEFRGVFHLTNTGKTPARSVLAKFYFEKVINGEEAKLDEQNGVGAYAAGLMFPQDSEPTAKYTLYKLSPAEMEAFATNKIFFAVYADIGYSDIFGTPHWTKWCFSHYTTNPVPNPTVTAFSCSQFDSSDTN